ncbi:hypothetical protein GCM10009678_00270 [Actinomadura kijaniata]
MVAWRGFVGGGVVVAIRGVSRTMLMTAIAIAAPAIRREALSHRADRSRGTLVGRRRGLMVVPSVRTGV